MRRREKCEYYERCGTTGHYLVDGKWARCSCLQQEINQQQLGQMYTENPKENSKLGDMTDENLVIEGPLEEIRRHVARVLMDLNEKGESTTVLDAYRLIEIFLDQDNEFGTIFDAIEADLLVILLGFGDPRNRYLPELLVQAVSRRDLIRKPTWFVLGLPLGQVGTKYNDALYERLKEFRKAATG